MPINVENLFNIKYDSIRREWNTETGKWYFSVVDVLSISIKSTDSRNYWKVLKNRLRKTDNELVTRCNQLKMKAIDGKFYMTDTFDGKNMLEILKLVSPLSIKNFSTWCDTLDHKDKKQSNLGEEDLSKNIGEKESYPQSTKTEEVEDMTLMIDGYKKDNFFIIQTFIAGTNIENILVSVSCNKVTIQGERKIDKNIDIDDCPIQELAWGKFSRTIPLLEEIEINLVEVTEHHGELKIKLPLINKERSRIVKVKTI